MGFADEEATAARARAAADRLLAEGNRVIEAGLEVPVEKQKLALGAYSWWRLLNRQSAAILQLLDGGYTSPEVAPLLRNVFNHAFALNWMVDNGSVAVDALRVRGDKDREALYEELAATGWAIADEYRARLDAHKADHPEPTLTPAQAQEQKRLIHELGNVKDAFSRYGLESLYPVYKLLSGLSHTSVATGSAYLHESPNGDIQIRDTAVEIGNAEAVQILIALLQAARAFSPLLVGDPLRPVVDEILADFGLENLELLAVRLSNS